jgi:hypothetical protein
MLYKTTERIALIRGKLQDKKGIVDKVASLFKKRWMNCAGFKVIQLEEAGTNFTVVQPATSAADDNRCDN